MKSVVIICLFFSGEFQDVNFDNWQLGHDVDLFWKFLFKIEEIIIMIMAK